MKPRSFLAKADLLCPQFGKLLPQWGWQLPETFSHPCLALGGKGRGLRHVRPAAGRHTPDLHPCA